MIRLTNIGLSRALHAPLYDRLVRFCERYTPEGMAEPIVNLWMNRMYMDDPSIHILVNLDDKMNIVEHAVVEVKSEGGQYVIYCHQAERDKPNLKTLTEGLEYIEKLRSSLNGITVLFVNDKPQAYAKLGGYQVMRYILVRYPEGEAESESVEETS